MSYIDSLDEIKHELNPQIRAVLATQLALDITVDFMNDLVTMEKIKILPEGLMLPFSMLLSKTTLLPFIIAFYIPFSGKLPADFALWTDRLDFVLSVVSTVVSIVVLYRALQELSDARQVSIHMSLHISPSISTSLCFVQLLTLTIKLFFKAKKDGSEKPFSTSSFRLKQFAVLKCISDVIQLSHDAGFPMFSESTAAWCGFISGLISTHKFVSKALC